MLKFQLDETLECLSLWPCTSWFTITLRCLTINPFFMSNWKNSTKSKDISIKLEEAGWLKTIIEKMITSLLDQLTNEKSDAS